MFLNFKKYKGMILFFILLFSVNAVFVAAQETPPSKPKVVMPPQPKTETPPKVIVAPTPSKTKPRKTKQTIYNEGAAPAEKSIAVDPKVNITFCVAEGRVRVNGWDRNEIRAFVSDGSEVGFKIRGKQNDKPVLATILGFDPTKTDEADAEECLSGEEIELDVPRNAVVNIKSHESETNIESVRKVSVRNVGGNIFLNDIAEGIDATTYQGGITVEKSSGGIRLTTDTGNIIVLDISSSEIGDVFRAKTNNGTVILKDVEHRQVEVSSNSGAINFNGEFLSGGQYRFGTLNGSISLAIPEKSSCLINATYGFGSFNSEIPLQNRKQTNPAGAVRNLTGQLGSGEATLDLTTSYGRINIKKQQ